MEKSGVTIIILSLTILILVGFIVLSNSEKLKSEKTEQVFVEYEAETEQVSVRYEAETEQGCVDLAINKSEGYGNCIKVGLADLFGYGSLHINCVTDFSQYLNICSESRQLVEIVLRQKCNEYFPTATDILVECLYNLE